MAIEDALMGEIAMTNTYFDEILFDECSFQSNDEALVVTASESMNGDQDPDRVFHGDKILFRTIMTFERVAGRVAYREPELDTSGAIDDSYYDEPESEPTS
jgi:hypothetical protein